MKFVQLLLLLLLPVFVYAQRKKTETVETVSKEITADKNGDSAKVRAIYDWITNNISYDYGALMSGEPYRYQSAELVFKRRLTTCSGYSNLMIKMLSIVGIPAFEIEGYTKDVTLGIDTTLLYADHSWVAFKANGFWYACDPTWDSSQIGLIKELKTQTKEVKTFRQRMRNFWYFFWSKKRKEREREKERNKKPKLKITQTVSYKVGVIRNPSTNYFYIPAGFLVKDHLPSIPQWQMTSSPVEKNTFCDSINFFGPDPTIGNPYLAYSSLNDSYFELDQKQKELYLAKNLFDFNQQDFGDKGHHTFVYLLYETGLKTPVNLTMKDSLMHICDTISSNLKQSINVIKQYKNLKTKLMQRNFLMETTSDKNKQKSLDFMYKISTRADASLDKGIIGITKNRNKKLLDFTGKISAYPDTLKSPRQLKFRDSVLFQQFHLHFDSLIQWIESRQKIELCMGDSIINRLIGSYNHTISLYENSFESVQNISLMYEPKIRLTDSILVNQFKFISKTLQDSVLNYFKLAQSFDKIVATVRELNALKVQFDSKKEKNASRFFNFYDAKLESLLDNELTISRKQEVDAKNLKKLLKESINPFIQVFKSALNNLATVKKKRQKYLYDYLKMKTNRALKLYSSEMNRTKGIKSSLKQIK